MGGQKNIKFGHRPYQYQISLSACLNSVLACSLQRPVLNMNFNNSSKSKTVYLSSFMLSEELHELENDLFQAKYF